MKKLTRKERKLRAMRAAQKRWAKEQKPQTDKKPTTIQQGSLIQANQREIEWKMLDGALAGDKQAMDAAIAHLQKCTDPECLVIRAQNQIHQKLLDEMNVGDGYAIKKVQGILDKENETEDDWTSLIERNYIARINPDGKIAYEVIDVLRTERKTEEVYEATIGYTEEEVADFHRRAREFEELKRSKTPDEVRADMQTQAV